MEIDFCCTDLKEMYDRGIIIYCEKDSTLAINSIDYTKDAEHTTTVFHLDLIHCPYCGAKIIEQ